MVCAVCRLAGAAGTTVTCPLEVVKTRLQVSWGWVCSYATFPMMQ